MSDSWNYADVWEAVAQAAPHQIAQIQGDHQLDWATFDTRANGVAHTLLAAGLKQGEKVGIYLYNDAAYMQTAFACMKAALVPVNTNYRYQADELHYLWDNADVAVVVFHSAFTAVVEAVKARCSKVRLWLQVDDDLHIGHHVGANTNNGESRGSGNNICPSWASPFEAAAQSHRERVEAPWGRSGDDQILIYTGGTTGRPRGVMWRQHDLYVASNTTGDPAQADLAHVRQRITAMHADGSAPPPIGLPAAPLMHGTAYVFASAILNRGGSLVTLAARQFDVEELLDAVQAGPVTDLCIVGDAFCRPMVDALDAEPARWNIAGLKAVSSSGMMWGTAGKARLLEHAPNAVLIDFLNSSEASGMGRAITSKGRASPSASFKLGKNAFVIDENNQPVTPGSGTAGRIAVGGNVPLGYYGDAEKSAETFPVINGVRCAVPGDYALVEADGSITLLGRGSVSINTGGEKVFPEEVEECIKLMPKVRDAVVVGVPDERFGETVAAVVEVVPGSELLAADVTDHVRARLARHKAPRHVMLVSSVGRGPNGKADYKALRQRMTEWLANELALPGVESSRSAEQVNQ